jgi:hypothetical protein
MPIFYPGTHTGYKCTSMSKKNEIDYTKNAAASLI